MCTSLDAIFSSSFIPPCDLPLHTNARPKLVLNYFVWQFLRKGDLVRDFFFLPLSIFLKRRKPLVLCMVTLRITRTTIN